MSNGGTFSDIPWPVYTEDDYRRIDQICEEAAEVTDRDNGAPHISIELNSPANEHDVEKTREDLKKSPFQLYRKKNYLSVSDVTSPAWCELQFDYGLRQSRSRPLKQRPISFVSEKGKEIHVNVPVATKREEITHEGKKTHKVLEKEIHKEEVVVKIGTAEEMWVFRLLDVLCRLNVLKGLGVCREVPVWGVLQDHAFLGIIDELRLVDDPLPVRKDKSPRSSPRRKKKTDESQATLDTFLSPGKIDVQIEVVEPKLATVQILDSKTRKTKTIPTHADTLPSRLQLMLYWRLLHETLSLNEDRASNFFTRLKLNPKRKFSESFKKEIMALVQDQNLNDSFLEATCLEDSIKPYSETIQSLQVSDTASPTLKLVYRMRGNPVKKLKVEKGKSIEQTSSDAMQAVSKGLDAKSSEALVIESPTTVKQTIATPDLQHNGNISLGDAALTNAETGKSKKRKRKNSSASDNASSNLDESDSDNVIDSYLPKRKSPQIIGTKKFQYKAEVLDKHLEYILLWWHGKRAPSGVDLEDSRRCSSCEYREGCEWREEKATELSMLAEQKSQASRNEAVI